MDSHKISSGKIKDLKQNKVKCILDNVTSKILLKRIFKNILRGKMLKIIKYNKKEKNILNIDKDDYRTFSLIQIEILTIPDKFGKIINIFNEEEVKYYHIYFNNDDKEIKRNNFGEYDNVSRITIIIDYPVKSLYKLFNYCKYIESIYFKNFYLNKINNMCGMFHGCSGLKKVEFSFFNTDNVTDMSYMFYGCSSLKELNISSFNTNKVTNMNHMFFECSSLKEVNISNFNINNVINMSHMFSWCKSLEHIYLPKFKINKITDMTWMFNGCSVKFKKKIKASNKKIKSEAFI